MELTDDLVSVLSSGHVAGRFREIEVEDRGGGTRRDRGGQRRTARARRGGWRVLTRRWCGRSARRQPPIPTRRCPARVGLDEPARCAVRDLLRRNVRTLIANDVAVRREQPDAVHQMRVAARRLRSALKTFGPLLDPEWAGSLRAELKWLADALAGARDNEVLLERLTPDLDRLADDLVVGPVRAKIRAGGQRAGWRPAATNALRDAAQRALRRSARAARRRGVGADDVTGGRGPP